MAGCDTCDVRHAQQVTGCRTEDPEASGRLSEAMQMLTGQDGGKRSPKGQQGPR